MMNLERTKKAWFVREGDNLIIRPIDSNEDDRVIEDFYKESEPEPDLDKDNEGPKKSPSP